MIRRVSTVLAFCLAASSLFAQGASKDVNAPLSVEIQFHNQQTYYETDEVFIKVVLTNNSPATSRFRLADTRAFSLDFSVQTLANQSLRPSPKYIETVGKSESVFTRDVNIGPGEQFSFVERLNDYKELPAGTYVVSAFFYPELRANQAALPLPSNRLSLTIRPDSRRQRAVEDTVVHQTQQILRAQALSPDQVIKYMLDARINGNREQYYLYLDLESLYMKEAWRAESYRRLSEMERLKKLDEYKEVLWSGSSANDTYSTRPDWYRVVKTVYDDRNATVEVEQKYKQGFYTEIKYYRYKLQKKDQIWWLIDYSVTNAGTE